MALQSVTTWVFDLDNTLYPKEARLFDLIEVKMEAFICNFLGVDGEAARHLRAKYWKSHGTTLRGLMDEHDMPPDAFLYDVHEIDLSRLQPEPLLAQAISDLPGRKIVYTNGSRRHAERVTAARGLTGVFDALYGVEHAQYIPKPRAEAFDHIVRLDGFDPASAAMFEDEERNLEVPRALGMATILVGGAKTQSYTQFETDDLRAFLSHWQSPVRSIG